MCYGGVLVCGCVWGFDFFFWDWKFVFSLGPEINTLATLRGNTKTSN